MNKEGVFHYRRFHLGLSLMLVTPPLLLSDHSTSTGHTSAVAQ